MNKQTLATLFLCNMLLVSVGFATVYYDLWMRPYKPVKIEWYLLGYRPTYEVWDHDTQTFVTVRGSWTLDFLQTFIIAAIIVDLAYLLTDAYMSKRKNLAT